MQPTKPVLSIERATFPAGDGIRVLLTYPKSTTWNQSHEIVIADLTYLADGTVHWDVSMAELVTLVGNQNDELGDLIQFGEENLPGVWIGGEEFHWAALELEGYQYRSPAVKSVSAAASPLAPR
jgi:hypothetical protein